MYNSLSAFFKVSTLMHPNTEWFSVGVTRQAMYLQRTVDALSWNYCCCRKSVSVTYSESVSVALDIQQAKRMPHIAIYGLSGCSIFLHIISQTVRFSEKLLRVKCVFWAFLIVPRIEWDIIMNVHSCSCNSTRYSSQILIKLDFSRQILKNTQISNLIKIRPVGAEWFHADGRTDSTKIIFAAKAVTCRF